MLRERARAGGRKERWLRLAGWLAGCALSVDETNSIVELRMGDDLQDKSRKELQELCSKSNIRTAGVKHEDLVGLLRNKLYPSAPQTPRSTSLKTRGPKEQTPVKSGGKGRNLRSPTLPHENEFPEVPSFRRKNSALSRKPLLTKSNTFSSRSGADLRTKARGVDQDAQEKAYLHQNSVRRLCQVNGVSPLSRRSAEALGQLEATSKESPARSVGESEDGLMALTDSNAKTEDLTSSPALADDANVSAFEPSDAGSDASRRVSEIATDAGPDTVSYFSDSDEFRSVSSEPISRLSSLGKRSSLRTESSKMSLLSAQSGLSFFTAGSWGSDHSRSMDNLLLSVDGNDAGRSDTIDDIFREFPEGSDFLVGDTDASELSFLDAGAADPDMIVNGKDHGLEADRFNTMHSPMARDYVNYNRGSETGVSGSSRVSIADLTSDQDNNLKDVNLADCDAAETSVDAVDEGRESPAALPSKDAESKELGRINDEFLPKNDLAPGTEAIESKRSSTVDMAKEDSVANDGLKDDTRHNQFKSAGSLSGTALDMEHSAVDGWGVDTPTQPESCSREDDTSSISNDVRYSEGHSSHAEPTPDDSKDESEVLSRDPEGEASSEAGSPAFDSKDYSVAKKLEFEPVEIAQLPSLPPANRNVEDKEVDESEFQGPARRVIETTEDEDSAFHSKVSCDEPSNGDNVPLSQPHLDMSTVTPISVNHSNSSPANSSDDSIAPEPGCPVDEQEGYNFKLRDERCANTCEPVHDYNEDGLEKEDMQAKLSFPLSIILWCSRSCSPISENCSQSLTA